MPFGLSYQGSKSRLAPWIVGNLPSGGRLVDLFCGGGAVSHCAAMSGKYGAVLARDIRTGTMSLLTRTLDGDTTAGLYDGKPFVTRADFRRMVEADAPETVLWSWCGNCCGYFCALADEPRQRRNWEAIVCHSGEPLDLGGGKILQLPDGLDVWRCMARLAARYNVDDLRTACFCFEPRWRRLYQAYRRRDRLVCKIAVETGGYDVCDYQTGDVVYCDPPYRNRAKYVGEGFDFEKFAAWLKSRPYPVYVSEAENWMGLHVVAKMERINSYAKTARKPITELLLCNHPVPPNDLFL